MSGSITPLPVMLEEEDRTIYERLERPKTIVVRYGYQKQIAELPYGGDVVPGCGSKVVARTRRGIELCEMLTTTCANSGCSKSVSRSEMLKYIENSGGKDYPFSTEGKVLRIATTEDLNDQARIDAQKPHYTQLCKQFIREMDLPMRLIEVECLLGGERVVFYYTSEQWVDFRELVKRLAGELQTRIEMHQVNAREEARLVADYEKCGQHCCCKQFLKVLKPVSMRSAKVQKATLDPHKISGRCGRLMCCLRYEDKTYSDLKKRLPRRKSWVKTEDGIGQVLNTQILTQLALIKIEGATPAAYPIENIEVLSEEEGKRLSREQHEREKERQEAAEQRASRRAGGGGGSRGYANTKRPSGGRSGSDDERGHTRSKSAKGQSGDLPDGGDGDADVVEPSESGGTAESSEGAKKKRRRRRRRRKRGGGGSGGDPSGGDAGGGGDG